MSQEASMSSTAAVVLPQEVVQSQLARVIASIHFADSPRLKRFLEFIVEESLAGREDRLKGYTVGLEVFDRTADFDPQVDTIVRVQAGQLRRRLDLYYADEGQNDPLRIFVPKGSYSPVFQVLLDVDAPAPKNAPRSTALRPDPPMPSICVMPFRNLSGDLRDQYYADGLTEETVTNLSHFKHLFVFSRSTTARFADQNLDIARLFSELGVDFVIEGSVRKSSNEVRVTVRLIDAESETVIFADRFERSLTPEGLFQIQDEIALKIGSRIGDRYGPLGRSLARSERTGRSQNWATYYWVTRFYDYHDKHDPALHLQVRKGLTSALVSDARSSDGWCSLSIICLDEFRFHINARPSHNALNDALNHALTAVRCDPENAFAYQALAMAHFHRREFDEFRIAAGRALALNPGHADILADIGICYSQLGEWDSGLPLVDRAIELSPVHPAWYHYPRAYHFALLNNYEAAIQEIKMAPAPGFFWHHAYLAWFFAASGHLDEAARAVAELRAIYPNFSSFARREMEIWCTHDALLENAISGWRKAGLDIPD